MRTKAELLAALVAAGVTRKTARLLVDEPVGGPVYSALLGAVSETQCVASSAEARFTDSRLHQYSELIAREAAAGKVSGSIAADEKGMVAL